MGSTGSKEEEDEGEHDHGGSVVREVQSGRSCSTQLHQEGEEGEHEEDPGEDEGHDVEGQVDVVLVGPSPGSAHAEVEHGTLATRHGGHGPWSYGNSNANDPGKRDSPFVHSGPSEEN